MHSTVPRPILSRPLLRLPPPHGLGPSLLPFGSVLVPCSLGKPKNRPELRAAEDLQPAVPNRTKAYLEGQPYPGAPPSSEKDWPLQDRLNCFSTLLTLSSSPGRSEDDLRSRLLSAAVMCFFLAMETGSNPLAVLCYYDVS